MKDLIFAALIASCLVNTVVAQEPKRGGTLNFGVAFGDVTVGVDPHVIQGERTGWVLGQVAEGLVNQDKSGNVVPWLAKSWTISGDGRTYTFTLRDDVVFHNNRKLSAEDVKFNIRRILDPHTGSFQREQLSVIDSVEAADPHTVVFQLKHAFSPFLSSLIGTSTITSTGIIAPESVSPDGTVTAPIGTGPFRFISWQKNGPVSLARFDNYWQKSLPNLDRVVFKPLPDEATRLTALRTGQADVITPVPAQLLPSLVNNTNRGFNLVVEPGATWYMLIMNNRRPPFNDVRVRRAVSLAIDRREIMMARTAGLGRLANDVWSQGSFWDTDGEVPKRDVDKAKALLAEAGFPDGLRLSIEVRDVFLNEAQVIQQQLKQANITVDLKVVDWIPLRNRLLQNDFDMSVSSGGSYNDPDGRYGRFYSERGAANFFTGGYRNAEIEQLLEQGRQLTNNDERRAVYKRIADIVHSDVAHVILYFRPESFAASLKVQNLSFGSNRELSFAGGGLATVWLK